MQTPTPNFPFTLIDLTHRLNNSIPSWDLDCGFSAVTVLDYEQCTSSTKFRVQHFNMPAGIGTHMDAPAHCIPNGPTITDIALEQLISPCVVINLSSKASSNYKIRVADILSFEDRYGLIAPGTFVIMNTGWGHYWDAPEHYHNHYQFPSLSTEAAELLLIRNISGLGIDTLSPDGPDENYPVHQLLLKANKYIVENVAHAEQLPPTGSFIIPFPMKVDNATEAPVRLVGFIKKTNL
jgi:kynurenine formamidase